MAPARKAGPAAGLRAEQEAAARWVEAFAAPGYGPHGGAKLVDGAEPIWVRSPAVALAEVQGTPGLAPYQDLAARLTRHAGDGATAGLLLAARLVRLALTSAVGPSAFVQGYPLARRQSLAALAALAQPGTPEQALAASAHEAPHWAAHVLSGLPRHGELDLDAIEVVAEAVPDSLQHGSQPHWLTGIPLNPQRPPRRDGAACVLLLTAPWRVAPRTNAAWASPHGAQAAEDALRRRVAVHLRGLGVTLVAASSSLDDGLADLLQDQGVAVATDVAQSRLRRLATATGARLVARPEDATADDLGTARLGRRRAPQRDWLVQGDGAARTLVVPAHNAIARAGAVESGERLLRAAGTVLADSRVLAGGGAWQAAVAANLRRAADAAPHRTPFAFHAAADALAALATDLRTNAAGQPSQAVLDAYACVRLAVGSAFELAQALLRIDARHARRPSTPAGLRGGLGKAGSPKGMPGDLPPLM